MKASLILDLVLLAILLAVAFGYARKGFLAGLIQFAGNLASLIGAVVLSQWAAPVIFEKFLRPGCLSQVEQTIEETGGVNLEALIEKYAGFLPESFRQSLAESVQGLAGSQAPDLADKIVGQVLEPLTTPMISLVIFFVALALFRLVVGFLVALLKGANHVPVLGGVNRTMGFCLGLLAGAVDVYILLCALFALMTLTAGQLPWLNQEILADSWGLRLFNDINPFL